MLFESPYRTYSPGGKGAIISMPLMRLHDRVTNHIFPRKAETRYERILTPTWKLRYRTFTPWQPRPYIS